MVNQEVLQAYNKLGDKKASKIITLKIDDVVAEGDFYRLAVKYDSATMLKQDIVFIHYSWIGQKVRQPFGHDYDSSYFKYKAYRPIFKIKLG